MFLVCDQVLMIVVHDRTGHQEHSLRFGRKTVNPKGPSLGVPTCLRETPRPVILLIER